MTLLSGTVESYVLRSKVNLFIWDDIYKFEMYYTELVYQPMPPHMLVRNN
jgi:hypothetical protein